jgi:hypothetical protein
MYKVIGGDHQEYGPATAEEVCHWLADGRLNGQSLVQKEGSNQWLPLSSFSEFAEALRAQSGQPSAPLPISPPSGAGARSEPVRAGTGSVNVGACLSRSWQLWHANFGLLFGASCLLCLLEFVCSSALVGSMVFWVAEGVLYGGLCGIFLNRIRGEEAAVSGLFSGFQQDFAQLMLVGVLSTCLTKIAVGCCLVLPGIYLFIAWIFCIPLVADRRLEFWSAMELSRKTVTRVWLPVFGLVVCAFLPSFLAYLFMESRLGGMLAPILRALVHDIKVGNAPDYAELSRQAEQVAKAALPLVLMFKFVFMLNLAFGVGALMYAYEDLFGPRPPGNP